MKNTRSMCQSCGMPLAKDPQGGGREKDGSVSQKYCSYCYDRGEFLSPTIDSAQKMQAFVITKLRQMGYPRILAWLFTRQIPRLERWKMH